MRLGRDLRLGAWLFALVASVYLLSLPGRITTPDGVLMFRVTEAVVERHALSVEPIAQTPAFGGQSVRDPATHITQFYPWFAPGMSFANLPAYLLGRALVSHASAAEQNLFARSARPIVFEAGPPERPTHRRARLVLGESWYAADADHFRAGFLSWMSLWTSALLAAGCAAGVFSLARSLGYRARVALGTALLVAFATPLWPYARVFFSESLSAFGLVWFAALARHGHNRDDRRPLAWALAGFALGLAVLAKAAHGALLLPAAGLLAAYSRGRDPRGTMRALGAFSLALGLCVAALLAYNRARFGSVFVTGYGDNLSRWTTPALEGLLGLLASPGRGLFLYCPLTLAAVLSWRRFSPTHSREWWLGIGALATLLAVFCRWFMWEGGWCWGPRYLVPVIPLVCLPVAALLDAPAAGTPSQKALRAAEFALVALSCAVAVSGVMVDNEVLHNWIHLDRAAAQSDYAALGMPRFYDLVRWDWGHSALTRFWALRSSEALLVLSAARAPGVVLACFALFATTAIGSLGGLVRAAKSDD